jgi:magnesium transporter
LLFLGDWSYPYTVALMVFSAALPMWYFGKRGWLK